MQHFPELFETLLRQRGIMPEEKEDFLSPDYKRLHDPLLLPDMEKARDRVIRAIENNEHIVVFSDYDADGIPGAVVLSDFFRRTKYENISFYIPHRHNEGFGLNPEAIEECAKRSAKLLITIDCGIADIEEVALANKRGIDVIITDHHKSKPTLPKALAVVNPNREDSDYPFKGLCGSAVVFKLVQAVVAEESFGVKPGMEKWSLDMVAIATLSDMVPLIGENRILARFGLDVLRKSPRPGLAALFRRFNLDQKNISEDDVVFMITPRINAASRMGVPEDAFKLLITTDSVEAEKLSLHLEKINNERKGVVASIVREAKLHLSGRERVADVIVVGNPDWRPALLGLVANSLVEEYRRPVFVWGRDGEGVLKGSCRSYNGYDLFALMNATSDSFIEFGGHTGAGGFSVNLENVITLEEKLSYALSLFGSSVPKLEEEKNLVISISDIGENLWNTISQFAPFGMGNKKPIFKIPKAEIKSVKKFGKEGNHLEVTFNGGDREIKAISFFSSPDSYSLPLIPGTHISLLANLEKSYFRNSPELRLRIVGIMKS
ncbi:MAG: single-stranded-DNA-specific exonuclease RecJ [Patescibacteria group bacterium]|nr:single-stranded-DNA-specific exonuclease RecJ [Patescibacteria group bacterium]